MDNENAQQDVVAETETEEVEEVEETDTTDWKAEALKAQGIAKRLKTKLEKARETKSETKPEKAEAQTTVKKSEDLDYGQKAYLKSMLDIKGADELALVRQWKDRTGDELDSLVEDEIFLAKLGKLREAKATAQAVPSGSKRATVPVKDSVDYHLEKYESGQMKLSEMPFDMRKQVLEKALAKKTANDKFVFNR